MIIEEIAWEHVTIEAYNKKLKEYKIILHDISGKLEPGKLSVIMGPSGSGKTTLINTLSGIIPEKFKTSGTIRLNKMPRPSNFSEYIGVYEQEDIYFDYYTIFDYLYFNSVGRHRSKSKEEINAKINEVLKRLNLVNRKNNLISEISGGERKRVMIARELLSGKRILFFDEATSNLDSHLALELVYYLKEWAIKENIIILISIHQPSNAIASLFDYFIFLHKGKSIYQGKYCEMEFYLKERGFKRPEILTLTEYIFAFTSEESHMSVIEEDRKGITNLIYKDAESPQNSNYSKKIIQYKFSFRVVWEILKRIFRNDIYNTKIQNICFTVLYYVIILFIGHKLNSNIDNSDEFEIMKEGLRTDLLNNIILIYCMVCFQVNINLLVKNFNQKKLIKLETKISCYTPIEYVTSLFFYSFIQTSFIFLLFFIQLMITFGFKISLGTTLKFYILPLLWLYHLNFIFSMISTSVFSFYLNYLMNLALVFSHFFYMYLIDYKGVIHYFLVLLNVLFNSLGIAPLIHVYLHYKGEIIRSSGKCLTLENFMSSLEAIKLFLGNTILLANKNYLHFIFGSLGGEWLIFFKFSFILYLIPSTMLIDVLMKRLFGTLLRYELEK